MLTRESLASSKCIHTQATKHKKTDITKTQCLINNEKLLVERKNGMHNKKLDSNQFKMEMEKN